MRILRWLGLLGATLGTGALLALFACGGPQEGCAVERWSGTCALKAVNTIRETETSAMAVSTLEIVWSPVTNPAEPNYTPPDLRQEYRVASDQVPALKQHLAQHSPVQCGLVAPPAGVCEPSKLVVSVPEFVPPAATAQPQEDTASGCGELDNPTVAQQTSHPVKPSTLGAASFQETYLFDEGSATASPDVAAQIQAAGRIIAAHPELVCIAVTGHITRGEPLPLADQRARAVRDLLVQSGVPAGRMVAFGSGIPVYGENQAPPPADPSERSVSLSVLRLKQ